MDHEDHKASNRPALRPRPLAAYALGRKRLSPRWWEQPDLAPGTTLLAREEHRQRRAAKPPKHRPDDVAQKAARSFARWAWFHDPALLPSICPCCSEARH